MEILGITILLAFILANASSFFKAEDRQNRIYEQTAADTKFNKSSHQNT